jgi:hypothetical protein
MAPSARTATTQWLAESVLAVSTLNLRRPLQICCPMIIAWGWKGENVPCGLNWTTQSCILCLPDVVAAISVMIDNGPSAMKYNRFTVAVVFTALIVILQARFTRVASP